MDEVIPSALLVQGEGWVGPFASVRILVWEFTDVECFIASHV